jgi:SAM-dependent methyltransferase
MPPNAVQTDNPAFYDRHWENTTTSTDPNIISKAQLLVSMVPDDVRSIVDIGCGDGFITHKLAERWDVTGVDRSPVAVSKLRCKAIEAGADALPLKDRSVDLVHSSQMLEHLPDGIYEKALAEMNRVASKWLLLSVPCREQLVRRHALCPSCNLEFHVDGHLRSIDETTFDTAFTDFERIRTEHIGPPVTPTFAALEHLRHHAARRWYMWENADICCPRCGETNFRRLDRNYLHRQAERAVEAFTWLGNFVLRRKPEPYWVIVLMRRRSA